MKIYLAARYSRRVELCGYRETLLRSGHIVTSRWLNGEHQLSRDGLKLGAVGEEYVEAGSDQEAAALRQFFAREDMEDVRAADLVIAFTEAPRAETSRGGRHVELGMALAWDKRIFIVGPRENVFCWLPGLVNFDTFASVQTYLRSESA